MGDFEQLIQGIRNVVLVLLSLCKLYRRIRPKKTTLGDVLTSVEMLDRADKEILVRMLLAELGARAEDGDRT